MEWQSLLCETRVRELFGGRSSFNPSDDDQRLEAERDYDRCIFSAPYKRLQDKAQVFPLEDHDGVRTRLTHTAEVVSVVRGLTYAIPAASSEIGKNSEDFRKIQAVAATAAAVHDLGNPPFGHAGERAVAEWFRRRLLHTDGETKEAMKDKVLLDLKPADWSSFKIEQLSRDFTEFDGNPQSQRLISRLQIISDTYGLNLTAATISASCKYTASSLEADRRSQDAAKHKPGHFASEQDTMQMIRGALDIGNKRHPLALLVEAADDIVNATCDLEDGIKKRFFDWNTLKSLLGEQLEVHAKIASAVDATIKELDPIKTPYWMVQEACGSTFRTAAIGLLSQDLQRVFVRRYSEVMAGTCYDALIDLSDMKAFYERCLSIKREHIFKSQSVLKLEIMGRQIIHDLMDLYWCSVRTCKLKDGEVESELHSIYQTISPNYRRVFEDELRHCEGGFHRKSGIPERYFMYQLITDQISGMTDSYAVKLHRQLFNG